MFHWCALSFFTMKRMRKKKTKKMQKNRKKVRKEHVNKKRKQGRTETYINYCHLIQSIGNEYLI